jgi:NADPH:quinone reductase-like Zn-dependent oxidoreductase
MKAAYIEEPGGPDKLKLGDIPDPTPGPGEVRVAVRAAGIGPWDIKAMSGRFGKLNLPYVVGFEHAGVVDQLGDGVTEFAIGDEVYGTDWRAGSFADYRLAAIDSIGRKPGKLSFEESVALAVGGATALEGLIERLDLAEGESVLVTAASGGVGTLAVQVARDAGARVIAVCGPQNHGYVRALGAEAVVDYDDQDWPEQVGKLVPGGVDKLFDGAGGKTLVRAFEALKPGGRAVGIVYGPEEAPPGISFERFSAGSGRARMEKLAELADAGRLRVELAAELPLEQAREALERVAGGHTRGKVVLKLY